MQGKLILTILTIQSSYRWNIEVPLSNGIGVPDTIQWWASPTGNWRVRTFALDHDIHTHSIPGTANIVALAVANTRKHYAGLIRAQHVIELRNWLDEKSVAAAFEPLGLATQLEIAAMRFAFWKPDDARYHTQSRPD